MHYPDLVDIFDTRDDLLVVFAGLVFLEALGFSDLLKQLIATAVLHYEEQILVVFDNLE